MNADKAEPFKEIHVTDGRIVGKVRLRAGASDADTLNAFRALFPGRSPLTLRIAAGGGRAAEEVVPIASRLYNYVEANNAQPYLVYFKVKQLPPPPPGHVTLCELNCELLSTSGEDDDSLSRYLSAGGVRYPYLVVPLPQQERELDGEGGGIGGIHKVGKRATGSGALKRKRSEPSEDGRLWHSFTDAVSVLLHNFVPGGRQPLSVDELEQEGNVDGQKRIRALAWHHYKQLFAIAAADGSIHLYNLTAERWLPTCLQHQFQTKVYNIAWKPQAANVLAVACRHGICLWRLFNNRNKSSRARRRGDGDISPAGGLFTDTVGSVRQSTSTAAWMRYLSYPSHGPVTSIAWSPDGQYLASGSPSHPAVIVWDIVLGTCTPLNRLSTHGISLVRWSPNQSYLFAATTGGTFFVWETKTWNSQKWTFSGPCQSAAWSPDSRFLLVSEKGESTVHIIYFKGSPPEIGGAYQGCEEMGPYEVTHPNGQTEMAGGPIDQIHWDPSGERIAVTFLNSGSKVTASTSSTNTKTKRKSTMMDVVDEKGKEVVEKEAEEKEKEKEAEPDHGDEEPRSDEKTNIETICEQGLIGIYATSVRASFLEFNSRGYIRGPLTGGRPHALAFSPTFTRGALLSVVR
ncbi:Aladin WD repeat nucleoporin [Balamuthia mandrillaris]